MSVVTIEDGSGDEIQIAKARDGVDLTIQNVRDINEYRMGACFDQAKALEVATAIAVAAGATVQLPLKGPDGYLVKRADMKPAAGYIEEPAHYNSQKGPVTKLPNFFTTLDVAKQKAQEWAATYKRGYTVYAVTEIGTAAPSAPPVSWTEK